MIWIDNTEFTVFQWDQNRAIQLFYKLSDYKFSPVKLHFSLVILGSGEKCDMNTVEEYKCHLKTNGAEMEECDLAVNNCIRKCNEKEEMNMEQFKSKHLRVVNDLDFRACELAMCPERMGNESCLEGYET